MISVPFIDNLSAKTCQRPMQYLRIFFHLFIKENKRFSSHFFSFAYTLFDYPSNQIDLKDKRPPLGGTAEGGRRETAPPRPPAKGSVLGLVLDLRHIP